jgi:hypothetical protein
MLSVPLQAYVLLSAFLRQILLAGSLVPGFSCGYRFRVGPVGADRVNRA